MVRPGPRRKPSFRLPRRLGLVLILAGVLLVLLWLGLKVGRAYEAARQGMAHLEALQSILQSAPEDLLDNFPAAKEQILAASRDMATLRAETAFLDPLLTRLGWVPRYGPELAAIPHLTAIAADLSGAGANLVTVLEPILPTLEEGGEDGLVQVLSSLQQGRSSLQQAYARLQRAAYERTLLDPTQLGDGLFARVGPLLGQLDGVLPSLVRGVGMVDAFLPQANTLLGMDAPQRYLIVGQNNFELRATGGFMGSMGILTVDKGRVTSLDYRRSYDWDNPNREKVQPPLPYVRYMRFGAWFIRDANWYADFPTSAQTIEMFWQLDGHARPEGVIAIDLYAVLNLLEVLGPVAPPGYGVSVGGSNMLETIWEGYRRDPGFLSALTGAVALRLQQPDLLKPENLPALLQAFGRSLEEKHLLLYFNAPDLQQAVVRSGWGGALRDDPGDYLYVVDSDFSYAEVNRFIEQEVRYRVALDHGLRVQQSTVTLTYRNRFDRWGSAETRELFGGACFDPQTEDLQPFPGCYGDYIRLYLPRGSRFLSADGFDDGMEYREEAGRTVVAGYVRVIPGEERTVEVTYVPAAEPVGGAYRLTLQKQPGTEALPVDLELQVVGSPSAVAGLQTNLRTDQVVTALWQGEQLVLSTEGPLQAQQSPEDRGRRQAFAEGLSLWQAGQRDVAVARWKEVAVSDLVLDRASLLLSRGDLDGAGELCQAALQIEASSARAYFLLGRTAQEQGDTDAALQNLERAVGLDPANYAAQLELGMLYEAQGDAEKAFTHLKDADPDEANQALWQKVWPYLNGGQTEAGLTALRLIIRLDHSDANALFVLADELRINRRYEEALGAYEALHEAAPTDVRYFVGRAQLYADQNQGDTAIADLETATQQAPLSAEAWFYLGLYRWRFQHDASGAVQALQRAVALNPNVWYASELANVQRDSGNLPAAAAAYEQAVALPGRTANTWWNLGQVYEKQELWDKAVRAYSEAVALEPGGAWTHAALANAYEKAGQKDKAIAEYEAALAIQPGQAEWQQALGRLKQ